MASQPLKWHGGKYYLAKKIIDRFPPHKHYVEPYFGGGAVLFQKPEEWIEDHSEVVNDLDGKLANFWDVIGHPKSFNEFLRLCYTTPFSEDVWGAAKEMSVYKEVRCTCDIKQAWAFFVRYRQSRQGLGKCFATLSKTRVRRGMNEQVSGWLSSVEGLQEAHERLMRVVVLNRDALTVIRRQDSEGTLFYLDPPYLHETRTSNDDYECEMSDFDHACLLMLIAKPGSRIVIKNLGDWAPEQHEKLGDLREYKFKGKFILSGYHSPMYDYVCKQAGWFLDEIQIPNHASSKKEKEEKTECLWMNF